LFSKLYEVADRSKVNALVLEDIHSMIMHTHNTPTHIHLKGMLEGAVIFTGVFEGTRTLQAICWGFDEAKSMDFKIEEVDVEARRKRMMDIVKRRLGK
jgi:hypothetical protein